MGVLRFHPLPITLDSPTSLVEGDIGEKGKVARRTQNKIKEKDQCGVRGAECEETVRRGD